MNLAQLIEKIKAQNGGALPEWLTEDMLRQMLTTEVEAEIMRRTDNLGIAGIVKNRNDLMEEKKPLQRELDEYRAIGKPGELVKRKPGTTDDETNYEQERTRLTTAHETERTTWQTEREELLSTVNYLAIDSEILMGLASGGCAEELIPAALAYWQKENRKRKIFEVEGKGEDAKGIIKTDMGKKPIKDFVKEWVAGDSGAAYRAARKSGGGGSEGDGGPKGGEVNPWAKDTVNYTEQGRILKADPAKADRMKREAGVIK